jgi:hypothetical protein
LIIKKEGTQRELTKVMRKNFQLELCHVLGKKVQKVIRERSISLHIPYQKWIFELFVVFSFCVTQFAISFRKLIHWSSICVTFLCVVVEINWLSLRQQKWWCAMPLVPLFYYYKYFIFFFSFQSHHKMRGVHSLCPFLVVFCMIIFPLLSA